MGSITNISKQFAAHHKRRTEVLQRDNNLVNEIDTSKTGLDVSQAGLSNSEYARLSKLTDKVKALEESQARDNGGYLTAAQQRQLNLGEDKIQNRYNYFMTH